MKKIILSLLLLSMAINVSAKAGPEIPIPKISVTEAINLASDYFYGGKTKVIDGDYLKIEEYMLISAQYTNSFDNSKEWAWIITFVHPKHNDHTVTYKVTNDKQIIELKITE